MMAHSSGATFLERPRFADSASWGNTGARSKLGSRYGCPVRERVEVFGRDGGGHAAQDETRVATAKDHGATHVGALVDEVRWDVSVANGADGSHGPLEAATCQSKMPASG